MKSKWSDIFDLQTLPILTKWLDKNDMLNCRLVCHKWNRVMENWLEVGQFEEHDKRGEDKLMGYTLPSNLLHLDFGHERNGNMIKSFTEEMSTHPRNPIIGKFVRLRALLTNDCCRVVLEFLQNFGNQLSGIEIYFEIKEYQNWQSKRILKYISKCLECVEGIKTLKIFVATLGNYDGATSLRNIVQPGVGKWFGDTRCEKLFVPKRPLRFPSSVSKIVFGTDQWTEKHVKIKMRIIPNDLVDDCVLYSAIHSIDHPTNFLYEKV